MGWQRLHRGNVRTARHGAWSVCSGYPNTIHLNATFQRSNSEWDLLALASASLDTGSMLHLSPQRRLRLGNGSIFAQPPLVIGQLNKPDEYDEELCESVSCCFMGWI